jgi:hypothetical protein
MSMALIRISHDPQDKAYDPDAGLRRVWCRDVLIEGWVTADEFRQVVITADGTVLHGPVLIEKLQKDRPPEPEPVPEVTINLGFSHGMFAPVIEPKAGIVEMQVSEFSDEDLDPIEGCPCGESHVEVAPDLQLFDDTSYLNLTPLDGVTDESDPDQTGV